MRPISLLLMLLAVLTWAGAAAAATTVPGNYASTGQQTCLYSSGGFNSDNQPVGSTWINSVNEKGTWTFKRDRTGSAHFRGVQITHPGGSSGAPGPGAATLDITLNFTYDVDEEGSITVAINQSTGVFQDGPRAGQSSMVGSIAGPPGHISGTVSLDRNSMTFSTGGIGIQTVTLLPFPCSDSSPICVGGMLTTPTSYRICNTSRLMIRLEE
jgi:hypothetical protein